MRGVDQLASIKGALSALSDIRDQLVFLGGCALAVYARPTGAPIRSTDDVDCITATDATALQMQIAELCAHGTLVPDMDMSFRYRVAATGLVVDLLTPGKNVSGEAASVMAEAARNAALRDIGGDAIRVVTPPFLLALKLIAFLDRAAT